MHIGITCEALQLCWLQSKLIKNLSIGSTTKINKPSGRVTSNCKGAVAAECYINAAAIHVKPAYGLLKRSPDLEGLEKSL